MRNIFIHYYLKKIKTNIVLKSKFYFYLIFKKSKLKELFYKNANIGGKYTVKDLLDDIAMQNVSLDTPVTYQRIEDFYFTEHEWHDGSKIEPWVTYKHKGLYYYQARHHNEQVEKGKLAREGKLDKNKVAKYYYDKELKPITINDNIFDQYIDVNTCFHDSENNILCLTAHI